MPAGASAAATTGSADRRRKDHIRGRRQRGPAHDRVAKRDRTGLQRCRQADRHQHAPGLAAAVELARQQRRKADQREGETEQRPGEAAMRSAMQAAGIRRSFGSLLGKATREGSVRAARATGSAGPGRSCRDRRCSDRNRAATVCRLPGRPAAGCH